MSELINNLNSIYNVKLQIKDVLGTDSDTFSEYPTLIEEAIAGSVSGYSYITTNGDFDISTYEMVNVNVPVPPGYIVPVGTYNITENGTFSVSQYENAYVSVQSSPVSIVPDTFQLITKSELESTTDSDPIFSYTQRILYTYATGGSQIGKHVAVVSGENFVYHGVQWYDEQVLDPTQDSDGNLYYFSGNNPNVRKSPTKNITTNGYYEIYDADPIQNYGDIHIQVPIDWNEVASYGYIVPSGTINIENNGTVDVSSYSSAYVSVSGGGQSLSGYFYNIVLENSMADNMIGQDFDSSVDVASADYPAYVINQLWTEPYTMQSPSGETPAMDYWQTKIYTYTSGGQGDLIVTSDRLTNPYYGYVSYTFPAGFSGAIAFYAESFSWVDDPEMGMGDYQSNGEVPMFVNNGTSVDNNIIVPNSFGGSSYTFYFFPKNKNNIQSEGQIAVINHANFSNSFMNSLE